MWLAVDTYEDLSHLLLYYVTSCDKNLYTPHPPCTLLLNCFHDVIIPKIFLNLIPVLLSPVCLLTRNTQNVCFSES